MKHPWRKVRLGAIAILGVATVAATITAWNAAGQDAAQGVESRTYDMAPVTPYEFSSDVRDLAKQPSPPAGPPVYLPLLQGPPNTKFQGPPNTKQAPAGHISTPPACKGAASRQAGGDK